MNINSHIVM